MFGNSSGNNVNLRPLEKIPNSSKKRVNTVSDDDYFSFNNDDETDVSKSGFNPNSFNPQQQHAQAYSISGSNTNDVEKILKNSVGRVSSSNLHCETFPRSSAKKSPIRNSSSQKNGFIPCYRESNALDHSIERNSITIPRNSNRSSSSNRNEIGYVIEKFDNDNIKRSLRKNSRSISRFNGNSNEEDKSFAMKYV